MTMMQNKTLILLLIVIIFFTNSVLGQIKNKPFPKESLTISNITKYVSKNCKFNYFFDNSNLIENKVDSLDHLDFTPESFNHYNINQLNIFTYTNRATSIVERIKIQDTVNQENNFQFRFFHTDSLVFFLCYKMDDFTHSSGEKIKGFFLLSKIDSQLYYFAINTILEYENEVSESEINYILKLDKNFIPLKKLYFSNSKIVYSSTYLKSEAFNGVKELIIFYNHTSNGCLNYNLKDLNLFNIDRMYNEVYCPDVFKSSVYPKIEKNTFFWYLNNYNYH